VSSARRFILKTLNTRESIKRGIILSEVDLPEDLSRSILSAIERMPLKEHDTPDALAQTSASGGHVLFSAIF